MFSKIYLTILGKYALVLASIFLFLCPFTIKTSTYALSDFDTFEDENGEIVIKGFASDSLINGTLKIPAEINGNKVVGLTSLVNVNDGFVKLNSELVNSIDLTESTNLKYISARCFKSDTSTLGGSLYLPESLESIGKGAFSGTHIHTIYVNRYEKGKDIYTALENDCLSALFPTVYFSCNEALEFYKTKDVWSGLVDYMSVKPVAPSYESVQVVFVSDGKVICSENKALGLPLNYDYINDNWIENSDYNLPNTEKDCYDFVAWKTNGQIVDKDFVLDAKFVEDGKITVTAEWHERKHNIEYVFDDTNFSADLQRVFSEKQGCDLPELKAFDLKDVFDGWYLDEKYSLPIENIEAGTTTDIKVYAKCHTICPYITLSHSLQSGTTTQHYKYGDTIQLLYTLNNIDPKYDCSVSLQLYDGTWKDISNTTLSNLMPNSYKVKCVATISYNEKSFSVEEVCGFDVDKCIVNIKWGETNTFVFTNNKISPSVSIESDDVDPSICNVETYIIDGSTLIKSDILNVGNYLVKVVLDDMYNDTVLLVGDVEKRYSLLPYKVGIHYRTNYKEIEYGETIVPEIDFDDSINSCGFDKSMVEERVYEKANNSYRELSPKRTLDEDRSQLKRVDKVGRYRFKLVITNPNYDFDEGNTEFDLSITKQTLSVKWGEVNFEYDGKEHVPTASATNKKGENIALSVFSAKLNANTADEPVYLANAVVDDKNYVLLNDSTNFSISKTNCYIVADYIDSKFYDGEKVKITACVKDKNGVLANNVSVFCPTDLTSVGIHEVKLSWAGDANHYSASDYTAVIIIKTDNIVFGDKDSPEFSVVCEEGFDSLDDVKIRKTGIDNLNLKQSSINSLTALYDVKNAYTLSSANVKNICLNMSVPSGLKNLKNLRVLKTTSSGETEEVKYVISGGKIKVFSSDTNATYIVVVEKTNKTSVMWIALFSGLVVGAITSIWFFTVNRRKKINKN